MTTLRELIQSTPELVGERDCEFIAKRLNYRPLVENAEPQQNVQRPLPTVDDLFHIVITQGDWDTDRAAILALGELLHAGKLISEFTGAGFTGDLPEMVGLLKEKFGLSDASYLAATARINETEPDPSWQAQVLGKSLATKAGLPVVTHAHVLEALR